eukprot:355903-Chlamydomonas_euryale.AAC.9
MCDEKCCVDHDRWHPGERACLHEALACTTPNPSARLPRKEVQAAHERLARPQVEVDEAGRPPPAVPTLVRVRRQHVVAAVVLALLAASFHVMHR